MLTLSAGAEHDPVAGGFPGGARYFPVAGEERSQWSAGGVFFAGVAHRIP